MNAPRLTVSLASLTIALVPLVASSPAKANPGIAVEQLSQQLQDQAGQLRAEIRGNFRLAPNFGQLVSDSQQIYAFSTQLRALSRANVNPAHLANSVRRMERLVVDLEDRVQDANAFRGRAAFRGYGPPVAPCDTRLAMRMLSGLDRTLANLDDAIHDLGRIPCHVHQQSYRGFDDNFGPRGPVYRGRGF